MSKFADYGEAAEALYNELVARQHSAAAQSNGAERSSTHDQLTGQAEEERPTTAEADRGEGTSEEGVDFYLTTHN